LRTKQSAKVDNILFGKTFPDNFFQEQSAASLINRINGHFKINDQASINNGTPRILT